ncbi:organic hydroperoxide resistance protein [Cribrihabitans sp. XS_ASV171]|uniref:Organic hydroperoxide resistance protein n=1 Tax=Pukyongiella litopenaei TaxID=2605946 RepID=A0A5C2H468_9RHOB|nr:organic hydroperoxide resistance protein [Pukyongiella litopenaei]QEP30455.1 organic hydroperoxide resistance protein [Pukyongiella litopenaei]
MKTPKKIIYETTVTSQGGRDGRSRSDDGNLDVALVIPKEMGGPGGEGTNPEQLFGAGYSACFLGAVKLVARTSKISLPAETSVSAKVGMGPIEVGYALTVELVVNMPGLEQDVADKVLAGAHERCPYSNATRGNIDVKLTAVT